MIRIAFFLSLGLFPGIAAADPAPAPSAWLSDWKTKMKALTPRSYVCQQAAEAPKIDGKLDDPAWATAAWTEDFVDIEGAAKPKPRFRTRAKMLWDDQFFYVAAEMEEPHVWGTLTKHDEVIFQDPDFEVFIDPNGDSHEYYEFEMNALNTGWDLFLPKPYKDGGPAKNEWEIPGLKTAVHVRGSLNDPSDRDEGWNVEMAFPWKVLGEFAHCAAPPREGDQWRVGFSRVEWQIEIKDGKYVKVPTTPENNWIWSAQGVIDMHRPERWGRVQFTKLAPGAAAFVPDGTAPARDRLQEVYYAQKDFHDRNKRWAATLEELKLEANGFAAVPVLKLTDDGYKCTVKREIQGAPPQTWAIRQDSLIQVEKTP